MSLFGEFQVPPPALALAETFAAEPEAVVEIDRVVAADDESLAPYVAVSGVSSDAFAVAARGDESVERVRKLHETDLAAAFHATWADDVEARVEGYTRDGGSILTARGHAAGWRLRMRFDGRENVAGFAARLRDHGFAFQLERLHDLAAAPPGSTFGLTPKQHEALVTAWEMGYFDLPRTASTAAVAAEIGISAQSLSDRLRRAQYALVGDALRVGVDAD